MVSSKAATVEAYLASLPEDRRTAIAKVREVILASLPAGYEEGMQYGMISYHVPLSRFRHTYNGQAIGAVALASQKQHMALYLSAIYDGDPELRDAFVEGYRASGKKLDMGKSCVRFKRLEDLPLDVVAEAVGALSVEQLIARHEAVHGASSSKKKQ